MTENSFLPPRREAVRLKRARKLSTSSQRWLNRQLNDPYVAAAKSAGYRSRAAFKMMELDDKYKLIGKDARWSISAPPPAAGARWRCSAGPRR